MKFLWLVAAIISFFLLLDAMVYWPDYFDSHSFLTLNLFGVMFLGGISAVAFFTFKACEDDDDQSGSE